MAMESSAILFRMPRGLPRGGFTTARLREGVKPSPTFLCASPKESGVLRTGAFMRGGGKSAMSVYESVIS
jgi:hypothetical protein